MLKTGQMPPVVKSYTTIAESYI